MSCVQNIRNMAVQTYETITDKVVKPTKQLAAHAAAVPCKVVHVATNTLFNTLFGFYDKVDDKIEETRLKLHNGCVRVAANIIPLAILPSLSSFSEHEVRKKMQEVQKKYSEIQGKNKESVCTEIKLSINDKVVLDGIRFTHNKSADAENRKVIVYFAGNAEIWQYSFNFLHNLFNKSGCDVICYNYRGCGLSSGYPKSEHDLIQDGVHAVTNLIKEGVLPKNITLYGKSLGGAIAAHVASIQADKDFRVHTVIDRSFKNLQSVISHIVPYVGKQVAYFVAQFDWQLKTEEVLPKLKGKLIVMYNEKDPLIPPHVSIISALRAQKVAYAGLQSPVVIAMDDDAFTKEHPDITWQPNCNGHTRPFTEEEEKQLIQAIKK